MKLRNKLFLIVGALFLFASLISYFVEDYLTNKNLTAAQKELRKEITDVLEKQRANLQHYLLSRLMDSQVTIDSLLEEISDSALVLDDVAKSPPSLNQLIWYQAARIMEDNPWIDFFQNTAAVSSPILIVPENISRDNARCINIGRDLCWVHYTHEDNSSEIFLGIRLGISPEEDTNMRMLQFFGRDLLNEINTFVLFSPKHLLRFTEPTIALNAHSNSPNFWSPYDIQLLNSFFSRIQEAKTYLEKIDIDHETAKVKKILASESRPEDREVARKLNLPSTTTLEGRLDHRVKRDTQIRMIAALSILMSTGKLGNHASAYEAPIGVCKFDNSGSKGFGFLSKEVFYPPMLFKAEEYFLNKENPSLASTVDLISPEDQKQLFVGNILKLPVKSPDKAFVSIGVNAKHLLKELSLAVHKASILVHKGKAWGAYSQNGELLNELFLSEEDLQKILNSSTGVVKIKETNWFYSHLQPFAGVDLHFIMLTPEKQEFFLLNSVDEGTKDLLDIISNNMRVISLAALLLVLWRLHAIATRISRPIEALARSTHLITSGQYNQVEVPLPHHWYPDEIDTLCNAFSQMVKGLKEKAHVQAVLNKVVSPQIANEILSHNLELGGEEKSVTVLFADIRNFTHLTENMTPDQVIGMLNSCMTKISHVIDEYGGVIDKYVGDEVMSLFGAPIAKEDSADQALLCAIEIMRVLKEWNKERSLAGKHAIEMGIGIHTGVVVAGNMGAENRLNYTVLGKNVNIGARLCSSAQPMEILVSTDTVEKLKDKSKFGLKEAHPISLKGISTPLNVYSISDTTV